MLILSYRPKEELNSYVLQCFLIKGIVKSLQPDVRLRWGLDQNAAFLIDN